MNRKSEIFEQVLTSPFDNDTFVGFVKEFLNNIQLVAPKNYNKVYSNFSFYVDGYYHIGNYISDDKDKIAIFSVCLKKGDTVERARGMQRNFVKALIERGDCTAAIVAFFTEEDATKWRLSFIRMDYEFSKGKITEKLTPAKRYSYLVGKGEPCHTAKQRLYPIFMEDNANPAIDDLEEAFSVEKVTNEFFNLYKEKYIELKEYLESNEDFMNEATYRNFTSEQFAKKLMGQIVFLYFIQKKGWLGVEAIPVTLTEKDYKNAFFARGTKSREIVPKVYAQQPDGTYRIVFKALQALSDEDEETLAGIVKGKPWGTGPKDFMRKIFDGCVDSGRNYFDDYLEPLFYTGLNKNRGENGFYAPLHRRIPFLNGGLFEQLDNYEWENNNFNIPNELFSNVAIKGRDADGILDIFDRYNFTMNEDEPMEREVAIDPEMLGKVFENLLDVKDRKSKGAFYTPREIVHYMCQETLINHLVTKTEISENAIRDFILYGEYLRDEDTAKTLKVTDAAGKTHYEFDRNKDLLISEEILNYKKGINRLKEIDDLLANVKVADLAVGSGAFPLGMLNEIVKARETLSAYMSIGMTNFEKKSFYAYDRKPYDLKVNTIRNCIFACDIEPSAVDIAKLRLWLSIVIDDEIVESAGNGEFNEHTKPRQLPNLDCNLICGNSLIDEFEGFKLITESVLLDNESEYRQQNIFQDSVDGLISKLIELQDKLFFIKEHNEKEETKQEIQKIYDDIILEQLHGNLDVIEDYYDTQLMSSKPFILWQLYFPRVFRDNGGFDIVIGNPPYVGESGHKELFREIANTEFGKKYYQGKMDLFYFFFHKGLDLIHKKGFCSLITTNYFLNASGARTLRDDFIKRANIRKFINFNELKIFQSALGQHNIITFIEKLSEQMDVQCCITNRKGNANQSILQEIVHGADNETDYFIIKGDSLYDSNGNILFHEQDKILEKMLNKKNYALDKKDIGGGIDILQESVVERHLEIDNSLEVGKGIFAVESEEINELGFNVQEQKILRPYYTSEQIKKYVIMGVNHKWIIYTDKQVCNKIDEYPNVKKHFDKYAKIITSDNKPYGLHRPRVESQFIGEKLLSLRMTKEPCFTYANVDTYVTRAYLTIQPKELNMKYVLALFNSKLFYYWLFNMGKRKGKQLQVDQAQILKLPIFVPDKKMVDCVVEIVENIMNLSMREEDISEQENQLNGIIYDLYELTEQEKKQVDGFVEEQRNM